MTGLLEKALRRIEALSQEQQDALSFREKPEVLRSLAKEALDEHRRGETRPLDETLGDLRYNATISGSF